MKFLPVKRSAQLVLCPQPNPHLRTPRFPRDLGAWLTLLAFCRVKVIPSLRVGVTLQHQLVAWEKTKPTGLT